MIVRKFRYSVIKGQYELYRQLHDIDEGLVLEKLHLDLPFAIDYDNELKPTWVYEAGEIERHRFNLKYAWNSENGNLFD